MPFMYVDEGFLSLVPTVVWCALWSQPTHTRHVIVLKKNTSTLSAASRKFHAERVGMALKSFAQELVTGGTHLSLNIRTHPVQLYWSVGSR